MLGMLVLECCEQAMIITGNSDSLIVVHSSFSNNKIEVNFGSGTNAKFSAVTADDNLGSLVCFRGEVALLSIARQTEIERV